MRKVIFVCIFFMFAGFVPASHADTYYKVTISNVTFDGTNACGGQCVETLNGSFELDVFSQNGNLEGTLVPGSVSFTASGPLGTLSCCTVNFDLGYIAISNSSDEFDIDAIANTSLSGGNGTGQAGIYMYSCESAACVADFTSPIGTPCFNCATGPSSGTVTFSLISAPVSTPEPRSVALLLLSIPAMLFWASRRSRFASAGYLVAHSRSVEPGRSVAT
ncbi:MAG TPA: PEP-CTERM sorting domain-containing protein [Candidatus Acidoferrum sp.]|nr:PEP-CTERM sorting domain-containing protein [Candidatus Acidoferrum sp.]